MPRMCPAYLPGRALHVRVLASIKTALAGGVAGLRKNSLRNPCAQGPPKNGLSCCGRKRVNQAWVSCPICRSGWSEVAECQLTQMCRQEAVPVPEAAADYDANSVQIPAEPPAPAGVVACVATTSL